MSVSATLKVRVLELEPGMELDGSGRYTDPGTPSGFNWVTNTLEWTPDPAGRFESNQAAVVWFSYFDLVAFASPVGAPHTMYARLWTIDPTAPDHTTRVRINRTDFIDLGVTGTPGPMSAAFISGWLQALIHQTFTDGDTATGVRVLWDPFDGFAAENSNVGAVPVVTTPWTGGEYHPNAHDGNNQLIYGPWSDFYLRRPNAGSTVITYVDYNGHDDETATLSIPTTLGPGVLDGMVWFHERDESIQKYWQWSFQDTYGGPFPPISWEIEPSQNPNDSDANYVPVPGLTLDDLGGFEEYDNLDELGKWVCAGYWGEGTETIAGYTLYAWSDQIVQSGEIFAGVDSLCRTTPDSTGKLRFIAVSDFDANVGPIYTQLWRWTGNKGEGQVTLMQQLETFPDDEDGNWHTIAPAPNGTTFTVYAPWDPGGATSEETVRWRCLDVTGDDSIAWRTDTISWTPVAGGRFTTGPTCMVWLDTNNVVYFATDERAGSFGSLQPRTLYARQYFITGSGAVSVARTDSVALGTLGTPEDLSASFIPGITGSFYTPDVHFRCHLDMTATYPAARTLVRGETVANVYGPPIGGAAVAEVDASGHITAYSLPPGSYAYANGGIEASMAFGEPGASGSEFRTLEIEMRRASDNSLFQTWVASIPCDRSYGVVTVLVPNLNLTETMVLRTYATFGSLVGSAGGVIPTGPSNDFGADGNAAGSGSVLLQQDFFHALGGPNSEIASTEVTWDPSAGFSAVTVTNPSTVGHGSTGMHYNNRTVGGEWSDFFMTRTGGVRVVNFVKPDGTVTAVTTPVARGNAVGIPGTGRVVVNEWEYPTELEQVSNIYLIDARRGIVQLPVDASGAPAGLRPIDINGWDWFDALTDDYIAGIGWLFPDDDSPRVWVLGPVMRSGCAPPPDPYGTAQRAGQIVRLSTRLPQMTRQSGSSGASG